MLCLAAPDASLPGQCRPNFANGARYSSTASSTASRYVHTPAAEPQERLLTARQPDGYLTEERKAAEDDHGFSTFFSETG